MFEKSEELLSLSQSLKCITCRENLLGRVWHRSHLVDKICLALIKISTNCASTKNLETPNYFKTTKRQSRRNQTPTVGYICGFNSRYKMLPWRIVVVLFLLLLFRPLSLIICTVKESKRFHLLRLQMVQ